MNEQDLTKYIPSNTEIAENLDYFAGQLREFQELMMMYNCAIREVRTKLDVLNDEMAVCSPHNPIEMIKSRVKKPRSIVEKLQRRGYPISVDSVLDNLHDVAGVRVICSFIDDIYKIAAILGAPEAADEGGGADPHHRHGILGKSGEPDEVQEGCAGIRGSGQPAVPDRRPDQPDGYGNAGDPGRNSEQIKKKTAKASEEENLNRRL